MTLLEQLGRALDRAWEENAAVPVTLEELPAWGCTAPPMMIGAEMLRLARAQPTIQALPRGERSRVRLAEVPFVRFQTPAGWEVVYYCSWFELAP